MCYVWKLARRGGGAGGTRTHPSVAAAARRRPGLSGAPKVPRHTLAHLCVCAPTSAHTGAFTDTRTLTPAPAHSPPPRKSAHTARRTHNGGGARRRTIHNHAGGSCRGCRRHEYRPNRGRCCRTATAAATCGCDGAAPASAAPRTHVAVAAMPHYVVPPAPPSHAACGECGARRRVSPAGRPTGASRP